MPPIRTLLQSPLFRRSALAVGALVLLFLAVHLLQACFGRSSLNASEVEYTFTAKRQPFRVTIHETGVLRPRDVEVVPGPLHGEIVWIIDEGTRVKKGDKLAIIDDSAPRDQVTSLRYEMTKSSATLASGNLGLEMLKKSLGHDHELARIALDTAKLELKTLKEAPAKQDRILKELALRDARLKEASAKKTLAIKEKLAHEGIESKNNVALATLAFRRAQAAREQAETDYNLTLQGTPKEDVRIAGEKVKQAQVQLHEIEKTSAAQLALKKASVDVVFAQWNQTSDTLTRNETILKNAVVYAPCEGTALYNVQWGRPEEGKRVWKGDPFLDIVNLSRMSVDLQINEVDLRSIGLGQKVTVRLEAFPEKEFHGAISRIAGVAIDRNEGRQSLSNREMSGVMIFDVVVDIAEADPTLRPTMTANLDIVVDEEQAIAVPYRAIIERGKDKIIYVRQKGRLIPRTVTLGAAGTTQIAIASGLREGDEVCVLKRNR